MTSINIHSTVTEPYFGHAWRPADRRTIHATVRLGGADVTFDDSASARNLLMAITEAAAALECLEADPELMEVDGLRYSELMNGVPVGQTAELLECRGGDQCHTIEEFRAAADALGRIRTMQELTAVLAKVAHYAPEVIVRAVGELV
jgi:hypothetical protein